ncbi:MAG: 16S rRNA (guanine(527)-N(7))-methyltransferase RsmG [Myxococcota bacterium]
MRIALHDYRSLLDQETYGRLEAHWRLVQHWSPRLNLTAIRDPERAAWRHYRDSLEPLRVLNTGPWADIGSGAGFPGVPLAIVRPDVELTLVEPRRKRVSFLKTVVAELALDNTTVVEGRSSDAPPQAFAGVVTRATFSQGDELKALANWCAPGGWVIALRSEPSGAGGSRLYSYDLRDERRCMEVWGA